MATTPRVPRELTRGPFTVADAARAGLTWKHLQGAGWQRLGPSTYARAGLGESPELHLAALCARLPREAVFSGRTAAWLHGVDIAPTQPIQVTIPIGCGVSARAGAAVSRARIDPAEVVLRRGFRCTSVLRTLADLARQLPLTEAVVVTDTALHQRLLRIAELSPGRRLPARLRRVAQFAEPAAESPMETRLRMLLVLAGLPRPHVQVPLHDERGRFLARSDLYYPAQRLAIEYDGSTHRASLAADNRRQNRLLSGGYRLLRFTAADVLQAPDSVVALVRAALS